MLEDQGITYRVEGGALILYTQEVQDLVNCLKAIDDPSDEVAIVGALRSPGFACSDEDLLAFKNAGGEFKYLESKLNNSLKVDNCLSELKEFHSKHAGQSMFSDDDTRRSEELLSNAFSKLSANATCP